MSSPKFETFGDFLPLSKGFDDRILRSPITCIIDGWTSWGPTFFRHDVVHETVSFVKDAVERRKGKVLIACRSMVEHLQSIERVANELEKEGLRDVTVHVISAQAKRLLKYIDSCAEWYVNLTCMRFNCLVMMVGWCSQNNLNAGCTHDDLKEGLRWNQ
jgi:hypothetical protein